MPGINSVHLVQNPSVPQCDGAVRSHMPISLQGMHMESRQREHLPETIL
jgi:hypothetical protein